MRVRVIDNISRACSVGLASMCPHVFSTALRSAQVPYIQLGLTGGTLCLYSAHYQLRSAIHYLVPKNCHTCQILLSPLLADVLPTRLCVVFQALTYLRLAPIFTGIPWPAMWVVLPEIRC